MNLSDEQIRDLADVNTESDPVRSWRNGEWLVDQRTEGNGVDACRMTIGRGASWGYIAFHGTEANLQKVLGEAALAANRSQRDIADEDQVGQIERPQPTDPRQEAKHAERQREIAAREQAILEQRREESPTGGARQRAES